MTEACRATVISDAQLVERVRRGDVPAYGALIERYELAVFACCVQVLKDRHAAEDVTQEVFVLGYTRLRGLREPARFGSWLLKTARREALRVGRRRVRTRGLPLSEIVEPAALEYGPFLDEDRQHLLGHVQKLPVHEKLMVCLRYFDGHSMQEIAVMTGRPIGTVTKRLSRAIERLRASFAREGAHV